MTITVYQYETKDYWLYYYSANWNTYIPEEEEPQLPSDLIKYKDKYLLFYIKGKKKLNEKLLHKALGITSIDELPQKPQGCIDNRRWFYLKNKKTNDSVFVQTHNTPRACFSIWASTMKSEFLLEIFRSLTCLTGRMSSADIEAI